MSRLKDASLDLDHHGQRIDKPDVESKLGGGDKTARAGSDLISGRYCRVIESPIGKGWQTMADEYRRVANEPDVSGRVALIERSILVLLVVGLMIGVLAVVQPFTTAILFGAALATAAWPIRQALVRR